MAKHASYHRSTIVTLPEDEHIIEQIKAKTHIQSRSKVIRFALQVALRNLEYKRIRDAYLECPETPLKLQQAGSITKISLRGARKEKW